MQEGQQYAHHEDFSGTPSASCDQRSQAARPLRGHSNLNGTTTPQTSTAHRHLVVIRLQKPAVKLHSAKLISTDTVANALVWIVSAANGGVTKRLS